MEKFEQLKTKNDILRFISRLDSDQIKNLENHLIKENYEIDTETTQSESPILEALNLGDEILTEDSQKKLKVIFEAAVTERTNNNVAVFIKENQELVESYGEYVKEQLQEKYQQDFNELEENLDSYLDYVIQEWVEENTLAIEKGVKVQLAESVLSGLKRLFDDNYIDVPDDKINLISSLENRNKKLYENSISLHENNKKLEKELISLKKKLIVEEVAKELTDSQKEKLNKLVENINVKTSKEYRDQVELLVETVKNEKVSIKENKSQQILNESSVSNSGVDPLIKKYLDAISKM